jgi:hypothetical protein
VIFFEWTLYQRMTEAQSSSSCMNIVCRVYSCEWLCYKCILHRHIHSRDDYYCIYTQPISSHIILFLSLTLAVICRSIFYTSLCMYVESPWNESKWERDRNDKKKLMQIITNVLFPMFRMRHKKKAASRMQNGEWVCIEVHIYYII